MAQQDIESHLRHISPLRLYWLRTRHPGTQSYIDILVTTDYLPQVSQGTHLSPNLKRKDEQLSRMCVDCLGIEPEPVDL